jgi:hypothetical protein
LAKPKRFAWNPGLVVTTITNSGVCDSLPHCICALGLRCKTLMWIETVLGLRISRPAGAVRLAGKGRDLPCFWRSAHAESAAIFFTAQAIQELG